MVDMAHFAGLVAGGVHPSPFPHAHVVTTTTHKTLRGPRGGVILSDDEEIAKKLNSAVFPGMQGGPLMHVIAAKAVAFGEALRPSFRSYASNVVENAKALAETSEVARPRHCFGRHRYPSDAGRSAAETTHRQGGGSWRSGAPHITCNKNGIPFDPQKADRDLGHPARHAGLHHARLRHRRIPQVGEMIVEVLDVLSQKGVDEDLLIEDAVRDKVKTLISRFPIYQEDWAGVGG